MIILKVHTTTMITCCTDKQPGQWYFMHGLAKQCEGRNWGRLTKCVSVSLTSSSLHSFAKQIWVMFKPICRNTHKETVNCLNDYWFVKETKWEKSMQGNSKREYYPSCHFLIDLQQAVIFTCLWDKVATLRKTHTDLITQESSMASVEQITLRSKANNGKAGIITTSTSQLCQGNCLFTRLYAVYCFTMVNTNPTLYFCFCLQYLYNG